MIYGISHVGVAVQDIEAALKYFSRILKIPMPEIHSAPEKKMRFAVIDVGGVGIELLEDKSSDGRVANFVKEKGEGIEHICFLTDSIEKDMDELKERNFDFYSRGPVTGLRGKKIGFSKNEALAFELSEP